MLNDNTSKAFGIKDCLIQITLFPVDLKFSPESKKGMTLDDL